MLSVIARVVLSAVIKVAAVTAIVGAFMLIIVAAGIVAFRRDMDRYDGVDDQDLPW